MNKRVFDISKVRYSTGKEYDKFRQKGYTFEFLNPMIDSPIEWATQKQDEGYDVRIYKYSTMIRGYVKYGVFFKKVEQ